MPQVKIPAEARLRNTGALIREYFGRFSEASPTDVHHWIVQQQLRRVRSLPPATRDRALPFVPLATSYQGIVNWFYALRELGIIELSRSEPTHYLPKNFYRLKSPEMAERIKPGLTQTLYPSRAVGGKRWKRAMREGRIPYGRSPETA